MAEPNEQTTFDDLMGEDERAPKSPPEVPAGGATPEVASSENRDIDSGPESPLPEADRVAQAAPPQVEETDDLHQEPVAPDAAEDPGETTEGESARPSGEAAPAPSGSDAGTARARGDVQKPSQVGRTRRELLNPDKVFYKMGEVCEISGLESHVLRFWESEFEVLKPRKNRAGHRIFTHDDIELVLRIKRLLYDEGYTIPGARKKLENPGEDVEETQDETLERKHILNEISGIRRSIESVIKLLDGV